MVYKRIFKWNNAHNPGAEYQLTELELPTGVKHQSLGQANQTMGKTFVGDFLYAIDQFKGLILQLYSPQYIRTTVILLIVWFTCAFGFYGLSVWFPEYIKLI